MPPPNPNPNEVPPLISRTSSSTASATAARPRPKRVINGLEGFYDIPTGDANSPLASPVESYHDSPFLSRIPSPIPSKHPSRSSSLRPPAARELRVPTGESPVNDLATSLSGLWGKSWTSLQGLASNVLGSDASVEAVKDNPNKPRGPKQGTKLWTTDPSKQWGPQEQTQPGAGSSEERKALVRAKKREELLMGNRHANLDNAALRYKRRTSDDFESNSAPPGENDDRDLLVYIHRVSPKDTLAGISIKFNCQLALIKKANRLWTNDGVQTRKWLAVPVEGCNIKGRRVSGPDMQTEDLLAEEPLEDPSKTPTQASISAWSVDQKATDGMSKQSSPRLNTVDTQSSTNTKGAEGEPWAHDSWVVIEGYNSAVEVARLPRQETGYFPRTRRKSLSYSDLDSPSPSFDYPRPSIAISETSSTGHHGPKRSRRPSASQQFGPQMAGPGGVGSLQGRGPSTPGPAEDKLNKFFNKHLPNIMAPIQSSLEGENHSFFPSSPGGSTDNLATTVEGWIRRLAKTSSKVAEPPTSGHTWQSNQSGDLIEMGNSFEIGEDEDDTPAYSDADRGRGRTGDSTAREAMFPGLRDRAAGNERPKIDPTGLAKKGN